jgi:hypothetical protein
MKNLVVITLLFMTAIACTRSNEINLKLDQHLNDPEHIGNLEIKTQKNEVLKRIMEFDHFYRENLCVIRYNFRKKFWWVGRNSDLNQDQRNEYLRDSLLPKIVNCKYLTSRLKEKALQNSKLDDPGNAGYILTNSEYGKDIYWISLQEKNYHFFSYDYFLDIDRPEMVEDSLLDISVEEGTFYIMSFVKIIDESHAVYKIHSSITNGRGMAFLIIELTKESGKWLVDDMYYIEDEKLIPVEGGYELLDYESNRKAFETGVRD